MIPTALCPHKQLAGVLYGLALLLAIPSTPAARAEQSILVDLLKSSEAIVWLTAETGVILKDESRIAPVVHTRKGAGVIIRSDGLIVTNSHTVHKAGRVQVELQDGKKRAAKIVYNAPEYDLALVQMEIERSMPYLDIADSNQTKIRDKVYSIGGSDLLRNTISEGKVSAIGVRRGKTKNEKKREFFQVTFNIYQGDSGSPIFNEDGKLLGIMTGAALKRNKVAYAIPSNRIGKITQDYLEKIRIA